MTQDSLGSAPSLVHFRDFIQPSWLVERLKQKSLPQTAADGNELIHRMPAFGLSDQQAKEVEIEKEEVLANQKALPTLIKIIEEELSIN